MTNREGLILEKWIDPQTRIHREFVVSLDDPRFAKDSTENTGIETRFAAKPSNWNERWKDRRKDIFFFLFLRASKIRRSRLKGNDSRIRHVVEFFKS